MNYLFQLQRNAINVPRRSLNSLQRVLYNDKENVVNHICICACTMTLNLPTILRHSQSQE